MKYIRTKDGEIIDTERYGNLVHNSLGYVTYLGAVIIKEKDIDREANTIEELCDEAIVIEQWRNKPFVLLVGGNGTPLSCARAIYLPQGCIIYGAVWVDANLIKVAKMNEKGELELL